MERAQIFARLTKVDEKNRLVYGRITQEVVDKSGEMFDYAKSKPYFQAWSDTISKATDGASVGNVRAMHGKVAAGKLTELVFQDDEKAIDVCAKVVDDNEWKKVEEAVYTGFSIGGSYVEKTNDPDDPTVKRFVADPVEVSLVDSPCVGTATFFHMHKADGTVIEKAFTVKPPEQSTEELAKQQAADQVAKVEARARVLCTKANMDPNGTHKDAAGVESPMWKLYEAAALAELEPKKEDPVVKKEDPAPVKKDVAKDETPPIVPAPANDVKKDAGVEYEVQGSDEDVAALAKLLGDNKLTVGEAVTRLTASLKPPVVKREFVGIVKAFADVANKKYPIDTPDQVRAAWTYINAGLHKYDEKQLVAIKAAIVAAWKSMIDDKGPDAEKVSKAAPNLKKSLSTCGSLAYMLDSLCSLQHSVEYEAFVEGDESPLPARLKAVILDVGGILSDMVTEEVNEEYLADPQVKDYYGNVLSLANDARDLFKAAVGETDLEKAKSMHAQKVHDSSVKQGAKCAAGKADAVADLRKVLGDKVERPDALAEAIEKIIADKVGNVEKLAEANIALQKQVDTLSADLKVIKDQPAPAKAILRAVPVEKRADTGASGKVAPADSVTIELVKDAKGEADVPATLIKMLHQQGGAPLMMPPGK